MSNIENGTVPRNRSVKSCIERGCSMNSQTAASDLSEAPFCGTLKARNGVLVLSGYGIRMTIERGHLCVEDGVGSERRQARFARVDSGIKRVVVLGHSGTISLDALRWLNDVGAAFIAIDNDADLISAAGPFGLDDARLRRAQAIALSNGVGLSIARDLIDKKLKGQIEVLGWFQNDASMIFAIKLARVKVHRAASIEELRAAEGEAARNYWQSWHELPVRFKGRDSDRVAEHWLSFGTRSSPLSRPSPRRAANPANALLNYVYAIVEAETRIASIAVGLDPAIGIMHSDLRARDSLACDLMEAIRPQADEFVLELIKNRDFRKSDFFETREGVCRILPPLNQEIAQSAAQLRKSIGPIAEEVAQTLFKSRSKYLDRDISNDSSNSFPTQSRSPLPTPLTQSNRSTGRIFKLTPDLIEEPPKRRKPVKRASWKLNCIRCGKQIDGKHRMYCTGCLVR
jgi:CRISPR-associated endonuclease Cas1